MPNLFKFILKEESVFQKKYLLKWELLFLYLQEKSNKLIIHLNKHCLKALKTSICFCMHFHNSSAAHGASSISSFLVDHSLLQGRLLCLLGRNIYENTRAARIVHVFSKCLLGKERWQPKCAPMRVLVFVSSVYSICKCGQIPHTMISTSFNKVKRAKLFCLKPCTCQSYLPISVILINSLQHPLNHPHNHRLGNIRLSSYSLTNNQ